MSCILFLIEISTQRHSMFGSSRSCLLFEKLYYEYKHKFHHDDLFIFLFILYFKRVIHLA